MNNPTADKSEHSPKSNHAMEATARVVSGYVEKNQVSTTDLPKLLTQVFLEFSKVKDAKPTPKQPPISIAKSIKDDYLICFEDGKKFKSLKRHLRSHFDMSPEEYRQKWGLPADYPMVAPNYAKARSQIATNLWLGGKMGSKK